VRSSPGPLEPQKILDEAAEMFRERGYHKTRMQDIAARFGVTHAALYYHFKSKKDILAQINLTAIRKLLNEARRISSLELPAHERFDNVMRTHFLWVAENASLAASLLDFDDELPPEILRRIRQLRREYAEIQSDLYSEGVKAGTLIDLPPRLAVNFIIGSGNWIYRWYHGDTPAPDELCKVGMRLMAEGYFRKE
jgi:TetR/AcrR family transcriptional regulator, cholesterol catabolism regulator